MAKNTEAERKEAVETAVDQAIGTSEAIDKEASAREVPKKYILMADLGLLFLAVVWGGGFVAGAFALETMTPFNVMAWRYIGAALVLLLLSLRQLPLADKQSLLAGALIGTSMFIGNSFQTIGLQYTTPAMQSFIVSSYTVIVPFISWIFLKEKPSRKTVIAAFTAMAGIAVLTLNKNLTVGLGDSLTMVFAVAFSLQVVFTGVFVKRVHIRIFTLTSLTTAAILSACAAYFTEGFIPFAEISATSLYGVLYLAVLNSAIAFLIQNAAQQYAPANHTALIMSLETVFGTIFAITIVGEVFTAKKILGCLIMFAAVTYSKIPLPIKKIFPS